MGPEPVTINLILLILVVMLPVGVLAGIFIGQDIDRNDRLFRFGRRGERETRCKRLLTVAEQPDPRPSIARIAKYSESVTQNVVKASTVQPPSGMTTPALSKTFSS